MICPCCSSIKGGRKMAMDDDGYYYCGCGYAIKSKISSNVIPVEVR